MIRCSPTAPGPSRVPRSRQAPVPQGPEEQFGFKSNQLLLHLLHRSTAAPTCDPDPTGLKTKIQATTLRTVGAGGKAKDDSTSTRFCKPLVTGTRRAINGTGESVDPFGNLKTKCLSCLRRRLHSFTAGPSCEPSGAPAPLRAHACLRSCPPQAPAKLPGHLGNVTCRRSRRSRGFFATRVARRSHTALRLKHQKE